MKVLAVAEKPSVARSIAQILSGGQFTTRNSPNKYIKNCDFSYRMNANGGPFTDFTVTSVLGHLTSNDFPAEYRKWHSCDPYQLLDAPIMTYVSEDMQTVERNLRNEAARAQEVMIWTDCDREGEHIGSEVANACKKANPRIKVTRARFSAIIAAQIHHAARNTHALDLRQAAAVEARTHLDLRIGAALTRVQTLGLQNHFRDVLEGVVSYGPCQFPTLGFVVDQYQKVQNFVPEDFWQIYVALERDAFNVHFNWKRNRLFDQAAVLVLFEQCVLQPEAEVKNVVTRPTSKWKPYPLTTVELQKHGSRLLRLPPKKILDAAESLYHKGLCSYPRTETDQFDPAFDHLELIARQTADTQWGAFATALQNGGFERPKMGKKNDKAHPPIHPVQHNGNLQGDEKRVYEYITRRYLAACSKNATGAKTEVDIEIAGEAFTASGLIVHQRNYLDVFPYDRWEGMHIPNFQAGERFMPTVCEMRDGQTTRPNLLTEADLVSLMDKNGIGTDATIAQHISTIIDRSYAMRQRQGGRDYLVPSTLGIGLVEGYNRIGFEKSLSKPFLRAETEQRMVLICDGERSKTDVINECVEEYRELYLKTKAQFGTLVGSVREYIEGQGGGAPQNVVNGPGDEEDEYDDGAGPPPGDDDDDFGGGGGGPGGHGGGAGRGGKGGRGRGAAPAARGRGGGRGGGNAGGGDNGRRPPPPGPPRAAPAPRFERDNGNGTEDKLCKCGEPAVQRTVRKDGPNKDRQFSACPKPQGEGCGFFDWADGNGNGSGSNAQQGNGGYGGGGPAPAPRFQGQKRPAPGEEDDKICGCGESTILRTVVKQGDNQGRQFHACPKPQGEGCGYFEWADLNENNNGGGGSGSGMASRRSAGSVAGGAFVEQAPRCRCDLVAVSKISGKEGDNKGRTFWICSKISKASQCKFFEWGDQNAVPVNNGGYGGNSRSNAPTSQSGGGAANVSCFSCGGEGHWSSNCPNKNNSGAGPSRAGNANQGYGGQGGGGGGASGACYKCGDEGHWSKDCPNAGGNGAAAANSNQGYNGQQSGGGASGGCYKCGEEGHWSKDCPNPGGNGSNGGQGVGYGYGAGAGASGKGECFTCGSSDHWSNACPQKGQNGGGGASGACFKCGEEGHYSRDCINAPNGNGDGGYNSRPSKRGKTSGGSTRGRGGKTRGGRARGSKASGTGGRKKAGDLLGMDEYESYYD